MRVGLVGCGRWGQHILRDLRELGCEVPVVARSDASIERARAGGAASIVRSVEEFDDVKGVVVATTTSSHPEAVERSLALGVPVFCEKPLSTNATDATRLAELAPDRLFVMDKWRYHPGVRKLAEIARGEVFGRVRGLKTVRVGWGNPHDDVDAVWVLAPHDMSIALEVLGELLEPKAAISQSSSGQLTSLTGVMARNGVWHMLEVSERSPERVRRIELHCDHAVVVLDDGWDEHITVFQDTGGDEPTGERIDTPGELPLLAELRTFVSHLEGGLAPRSSAAEGAAVVDAIARLRSLAEAT